MHPTTSDFTNFFLRTSGEVYIIEQLVVQFPKVPQETAASFFGSNGTFNHAMVRERRGHYVIAMGLWDQGCRHINPAESSMAGTLEMSALKLALAHETFARILQSKIVN